MTEMTISSTLNDRNLACRLAIKNIPENLSNEQLIEILNKNFDNSLKDIQMIKPEHKYNTRNYKFCFVTAENFEIRKKVFSFFNGFDVVDPKGFKQKMTVVDCLFQNKIKGGNDPIQGTIGQIDHFEKFKEYFSNGKIVEFKTDELKFFDKVFDGIEEITPQVQAKTGKGEVKSKTEGKPSKMIITKKQNIEPAIDNSGSQIEIIQNQPIQNVQTNFSKDMQIEIIQESKERANHKNTKYNKNKNYNDNNYYTYNKKGYSNKKQPDNSYNDNYYGESNYNTGYYEEGYNNGYDGKYYKDTYHENFKDTNENSYNNGYNYKKGGFKKGGYK